MVRKSIKFYHKFKKVFSNKNDGVSAKVNTYLELLSQGEHIIIDVDHYLSFLQFIENSPDKEKFEKIKIHALSKKDAYSLGAYLVDQSAAASFKIKPISVKAKPLKLDIDPWSFNKNKFYTKGNIYIEKTAHRIDTQGELEGITAQGILTRMQKTQKPITITKKPRVIKEKPMFEDIFTTDFNRMEKDMMKMMNWGF